ncbi:MAG: hypothetical protein ABJD07_04965 [Gemmatimonadaceae bacterium]
MIRHSTSVVLALIAAGAFASPAHAQRTRPRVGGTIEIRGTVPTPQVVTVRPREAPSYSRAGLVPTFYNRSFLADILPGYQVIAQRQLTNAALAGANTTTSAPALEMEIEAIRRDLEQRQMRLDSISGAVKRLGTPDTSAAGRARRPPAAPTSPTPRPPTAQTAEPSRRTG